MSKQLIYIIRALVFSLIIVGTLIFMGILLQPKRTVEIAVDNYHDEHQGLYELDKNTVDVLYIGSSHSFSAISPEDIFMQYGITGYVQASSCQKVWQSYYYLKEFLYTQNPKVVVLDAFMALDGEPQSEAFNREAVDKMKMSPAKIESAWQAYQINPDEEDFLSYLLPVFRYHDRWKELTDQDYKYFTKGRKSSVKGFLPRTGKTAANFNINDYSPDAKPGQIHERCKTYLKKIKDLCKEKGIEFVLVKYPTCLWNAPNSLAMQNWANENEVKYLDFNSDEALRNAVNIDWSTETLDQGNHINYDGAMKVSTWMGKWLSETYGISDKRQDSKYKVWSDDYAYYKKCVMNSQIAESTDFQSYIKTITDNDYVICSNVRNIDLSVAGNAKEQLKLLGYTDNKLAEVNKKANFTVYDKGNGKFEKIRKEEASFSSGLKGMNIFVKSTFINDSYGFQVIYDNKDYAKNQDGLQIVVFDPVTKTCIDTSVWTIGENAMLSRVVEN